MANGKKSEIGTSKYFADITAYTIFLDIRLTSPKAFSDCITAIAQKASKALSEIYEDISSNGKTIKFLPNQFIDSIRKFSENLYEIKDFSSASMRRSANDIRSKLASLCLKSNVSIRDVEKAAEDIVKKNPLKLSDRDKKALVEKSIKSGVSAGKDKTQKDYLEALFKKYSKDVVSAALDYLDCDRNSNKGKNGFPLGSPPYIEKLACDVFGYKFVKSSLFHTFDRSYKDGIKKQFELIINKIKQDVKTAYSRSEYLEYDMRERMMAVMIELSRNVSGSPVNGFREELSKLRRLEDFNNKVIKVDKTGWQYPVDAELVWERGENILRIHANIFFSGYETPNIPPPAIVQKREERKQIAMDGFRLWAGNYTVFSGQKIKVEMDIHETNANFNAVWVRLMSQEELDAINSIPAIGNELGSRISRSFAWGGINLTDWQGLSPGKTIVDWSPTGPKVMHFAPGANSDTAKHEFAHMMGIGDMYADPVTGLDGVDASLYADLVKSAEDGGYKLNNSVMINNTTITNNDIEMVILAFSTGKRQNYQKQFGYGNVSEALGKGN